MPESSNSLTLADMLASVGVMIAFFLEEYVERHVDADDEVDLHVSDLAGLRVDGEGLVLYVAVRVPSQVVLAAWDC